jgi:hypothetical protein
MAHMGRWHVDTTSRAGILHLVLEGSIDVVEMRKFERAHNAGVDSFFGQDYRVLCDIRELLPFSPAAADLMEQCKEYSSRQSNFRGSAVLVKKQIIALQHQRTSVGGGVMDTELITDDVAAAEAHLANVHRLRSR